MNWKKKYSGGFVTPPPTELRGSVYIDTWLLDRDKSSKNKLYFKSYDSNLLPLTDITSWISSKEREIQIEYARQKFTKFNGNVWLDSLQIK